MESNKTPYEKVPFEKLWFKKQYRQKPKPVKPFEIIGFDTETIKGRAELITNSYGDVIHPNSFYDCVGFLCKDATRGSVGFFYNLKYDFQAILKWLEPEYWKTVYKEGKVSFTAPDGKRVFTLHYIPQKQLKISYKTDGKNNRSWAFYDISQFFGKMKLENAASKYLGEHKQDLGVWDITKLTMQDMRHPDIIKYCVHDSVLAHKLAVFFNDLGKTMGLHTKNFSSPATIAVRYFTANAEIPDINRFISKPAYRPYIRYAWQAIKGAFINVFKRGYFPEVYVYDINSCYPYQMTKLPDISKGRFFYRKGKPEAEFTHGWLKVRAYIDPNEKGGYSPCLPLYRKGASNYFPVGEFATYITLLEYERLKSYFEIEIIDGIYWRPDGEIEYFLKEAVENTYLERIKTEDPNIKYFLKIVLNGMYGKFLEKHECLLDPKDIGKLGMLETGNLFNPFYASYILAGSRLQLFDAIMSTDQDNLIACSTDSVMVKRPMPNLELSKDLGAWSIDDEGDAVVIGCGVYSIRDKDLNMKTRLRGFHVVNVAKEDESMRAKYDLFSMIEKQKDREEIVIDTITNITPLKSIIQKMPEQMNYLIKDVKHIKPNFDTKRLWDGQFKSVGDLLKTSHDSSPIDFNL